MGEININPSLLRTVANNLNKTLQSFDAVIGSMSKIEQDIPSAWKSEYTEVYLDKFSDVKGKVQKARTDLINIQNGLRITATNAENLEKSLVQMVLDRNNPQQR